MDFTVARFLRLIVSLVLLAFVGWVMYELSMILTILVISFLLAYIMDPVASYLEGQGLSRTGASVLIFVAAFSVFTAAIILFVPILIDEVASLQTGFGTAGAEDVIKKIEEMIVTNLPFLNVTDLNLHEKFTTLMASLSGQALNLAADLVSIISVIVIIPFVSFFLLKDGRAIKKRFVSFMPNRYFEMTMNMLYKMDRQLGGYLRGQVIDASSVGVLAIFALWLIGVKYFTVIGIFAGLANMIPYVGPVAGAIPAIIVTMTHSGDSSMILYVVLAFAIVQLIDNVVIQPLVLSRSVNQHPLTIVFAVLIGGKFFGVLGMFLAVPAAGILKVTANELYYGIKKFNFSRQTQDVNRT
jgi:putative permease